MKIDVSKTYRCFTDGGARGNPGPAALGVAIVDPDGAVLHKVGRYLGSQTNNYAEYMALQVALEEAKRLGIQKLDCYLDSELVVKQLAGEYRVKNKPLQIIYEEVKKIACNFEWIRFSHVPREDNKIADGMVNQALDEAAE